MEEKIITNPIKVIRAHCLYCCCDSPKEVKLCSIKECPLHQFRFGKNPYRKQRILSKEQTKHLAENLAIARENFSKGDSHE